MAPYEDLYGRKSRPPIHWYETGHANIEQMDSMRDTTETGRYDTAKARDFLKSIEEFF